MELYEDFDSDHDGTVQEYDKDFETIVFDEDLNNDDDLFFIKDDVNEECLLSQVVPVVVGLQTGIQISTLPEVRVSLKTEV